MIRFEAHVSFVSPGRVIRANPESGGSWSHDNREIPDRSALRTVRNDGVSRRYTCGASSSRPRLAGSIPHASTATIWIVNRTTISVVTPLTP